ncbi:hypothetical protein OG205_04555 [Lentzea sp. NBC_00516]|uniref:hypothetical protein n=1 Tax=Lentzea sp. NBC_00516 TaxID=2903582 RepID=UPI002E80BC06|nr:hypothetical protein [Lentzea sp. NBC_00516]WUD26285.1 hypothetical protein OG205_04555 [Lentzea sp. NBC_00516]
MIRIPTLLSEPLATETLDFLRSAVTEPVANHCIRSYVYAELLVDQLHMRSHEDYHPLEVFYAVALHAAIVGQAKANPAKAPLASLALYLLTTENMGHDRNMAARWGD